MSDPNDPEDPLLAPFPTRPVASPFPPLADQGRPPDPPSDWNAGADAHDLPTRESRLKALGRFAFPPDEPPGEPELAARDQRWTTRVILVATLFLLIFNAASIQNWARQQAPGWTTSTVRQLGDVWAAQLEQLGADQPRQGVREAYEAFRDQRFVGVGGDDSPRS